MVVKVKQLHRAHKCFNFIACKQVICGSTKIFSIELKTCTDKLWAANTVHFLSKVICTYLSHKKPFLQQLQAQGEHEHTISILIKLSTFSISWRTWQTVSTNVQSCWLTYTIIYTTLLSMIYHNCDWICKNVRTLYIRIQFCKFEDL